MFGTVRCMLDGRDETVAGVVGALGSDGRVVIVGAGGVGKATLARQVAEHLAPDRTVWLELERHCAPASLALRIVDAVGDQALAGDSAESRLRAATEGRRLLVVLDGADVDIDDVVELASAIPTTAIGPWLVITSRVRPVTALAPVVRLQPFDLSSTAEWQTAMTLFRSWYLRAGGVVHSIDDRAEVVARILRMTAGIPLAIRVAAAAAAATGLDAAEASLSDGEGHEELTSCIDRSVQLLSSPERLVFDSYGVTSGSMDIETTAAVSGLSRSDALAALGSLVRHNLVEPEGDEYRMLSPVHRFAVARSGELAALWDRCRSWHELMAGEATWVLRHAQDVQLVVQRLLQSTDVANIIGGAELTRTLARSQFVMLLQHAAAELLRWVVSTPALQRAEVVDQRIELLRLLAIALAESEGVDAALTTLDDADGLVDRGSDPARAAARLISLRATFLHDAGRLDDSLRLVRSAAETAGSRSDRFNEVQSRLHEATMLLDLGRLAEAEDVAVWVIELCDDTMAPIAQTAWSTRAMAAVERGDRAGCVAIARRQLRESQSLGEAIDAEYLLMLAEPTSQSARLEAVHRIDRTQPGEWMVYLEAQAAIATKALVDGEHDLALTVASDIVVVAEVVPLFWMRLEGLLLVGDAALLVGDRRQAWLAHQQVLSLAAAAGCVTRVADAVDGLARLMMAGDRRSQSLAAAGALRVACGADRRLRPWLPELPIARQRTTSPVTAGWVEGTRLTDMAIDVIVTAAADQPARGDDSGLGSLSPAELRVARLVAQGCTNREIGERLYIARRTVETHVVHAFQKLGVQNRTQLATFVNTSDHSPTE